METCLFDKCNNRSVSKKYCDKHYRRFKKYGDAKVTHIHIKKTCLDGECSRFALVKGYCDKHYRRVKRTGTSKIIKNKLFCIIDGCKNKHLAKSLCYTHYWMKAQKVKIDNQANMLIQKHNGLCDICGTDRPGYSKKSFNIDHDHKTGIVRGLLCHKCNIGLGNFNDNSELLGKAIKYLLK
jgi:hypothetical protein